MTISPSIGGRHEDVIRVEAERRGVRPVSVSKAIIESAIDRGMVGTLLMDVDVSDIDTRTRGRPGKWEYRGKLYSVRELAEKAGIRPCTMAERLNNGWPVERALNEPVRSRGRREPFVRRAG